MVYFHFYLNFDRTFLQANNIDSEQTPRSVVSGLVPICHKKYHRRTWVYMGLIVKIVTILLHVKTKGYISPLINTA